VPPRNTSWTAARRQVTLNYMNAPAPHASVQRVSAPRASPRARPRADRLFGVLLGWLRFAAMALVGMLGVWLLVLLFG
jgi:hypothetical protein